MGLQCARFIFCHVCLVFPIRRGSRTLICHAILPECENELSSDLNPEDPKWQPVTCFCYFCCEVSNSSLAAKLRAVQYTLTMHRQTASFSKPSDDNENPCAQKTQTKIKEREREMKNAAGEMKEQQKREKRNRKKKRKNMQKW